MRSRGRLVMRYSHISNDRLFVICCASHMHALGASHAGSTDQRPSGHAAMIGPATPAVGGPNDLNTLLYPEFDPTVFEFIKALSNPETRNGATSDEGLAAAMRFGLSGPTGTAFASSPTTRRGPASSSLASSRSSASSWTWTS